MAQNLKQAKETLSSLKFLQKKHKILEQELIRLGSQELYDKTKKFYADAIAKLLCEMRRLPLGRRYSGTFYIRKPYSITMAFDKIEGSAFMREDLISWQIEGTENRGYCRMIFKKPDSNYPITKEDAKPVYMEIEESFV